MSDVFPQAELQAQIYCWVKGKAPQGGEWNHKKNLLTLQQIQEGKKPSWATGAGWCQAGTQVFCALTLMPGPSAGRCLTPRFEAWRSGTWPTYPPRPPSSQENQIGGGLISGCRANGGLTCRVQLHQGDLELRWER